MRVDRHTVWPASIVGALILIASLLFLLLHLSRTVYPVNMDMMYMQGYQQVNKSYDQIVASQKDFDSSFEVSIVTNKHSLTPIEVPHFRDGVQYFEHGLTLGKNRFFVELKDKNGAVYKNANITALISRMDTDEFDQKLEAKFVNGRYEFGAFVIDHEGRYKIIVQVVADGKTGFFEKSSFAK